GAANRVEVIMPSHPGWSTVGSSYSTEGGVYGKITIQNNVAVILPPNLIETYDSPCCGATMLPGCSSTGVSGTPGAH
ncbi:MAG: hypothetical protein ABID40_02920, partial [Candidatus Bipolaricaulota bacterium]